jgi:WhiB family redox-sensing transcriptional regulator
MTASPITIETELVSWRDDAACKDSEIDFFPNPEDVSAISAAKEICSTCPVADECLTYAIDTRQGEGVWGGHTAKERVKIRRKWAEQVRRAS